MPEWLQKIHAVMTTPVRFGQGADAFSLSLAKVLVGIAVLIAASVVSRVARSVVRRGVLSRMKVDPGVEFVFLRVLHFAILTAGVLVAMAVVGIEMTSLAVLGGTLGVGLGFGLRNIADNFVSGVIMLLERPINVGDRVTVGDSWGEVRAINLRSTVLLTPDNVSLIVPNSEFVSGRVTNWSHGDPKVRVHVPVGVAYGSDVPLVRQTLLNVAAADDGILSSPRPEVWFTGFADSALTFELLVWIGDPRRQPQTVSRLNYAIDDAFRAADIHIPFPQHDVYVKEQPGAPRPA